MLDGVKCGCGLGGRFPLGVGRRVPGSETAMAIGNVRVLV